MALPFSFVARNPSISDMRGRMAAQPEYEFGTNTGRQGIFNPDDDLQVAMALQRLRELQSSYGDKLDPNFTGETGVSNLGGYSKMANARTEAQNIQRLLRGKDPLQVKFDPRGAQNMPMRGLMQVHPTEDQLNKMDRFQLDDYRWKMRNGDLNYGANNASV